MAVASALGEYLRARRELVDPAEVGIVVTGRRRTPGLRREEVATLAGVSADYYLRLEQGRDRNPSAQVLRSLARVLRLDPEATDHLLALADASDRVPRPPRRETVPVGIRLLLDSINLPAFVENRRFDVLAANPLATAVLGSVRPGVNRLRSFFLDDDDRALFADWEQDAAGMVAGFRRSVGATDDPETARLVGELSLRSEAFRMLWARHDVLPLAGGRSVLAHPVVGRLELRREKLPLADTDGQILAIYHAEPGSESARSLALLGSLSERTPSG